MLVSRLIEQAKNRKEQGLFRAVGVNTPSANMVDFASNDYLGLATHPKVIEQQVDALKRFGSGGRASELVVGHSAVHQEFCERFADFLGFEKAMLFSSGFAANTGVLRALLQTNDMVLHDRLNHASLLDASLSPGVGFRRFKHSDVDKLIPMLASYPQALVALEGVYSMDGDQAPLAEIIQQLREHCLYLDDAHGLGVLGAQGRGTMSAQCVDPSGVDIHMNTLGKAIGGMGAVVCASSELIEALQNFSKSYVYSTALPAHQVVAAQTALDLLQSEPQHQERLQRNIAYFRGAAQAAGHVLAASATAIQPLLCDDPIKAAGQLKSKGFIVGAIRPPTVPKGEARLRITLSAVHKKSDIDRLIEALSDV